MNSVIKHIKLPFSFPVAAMQKEVAALETAWIRHYQVTQYEGEWSALPLRSINGSLSSLTVDNNVNEQFADTPLMEACPVLKEVVASLKCEKTTVRLLKLKPGSVIKEHTDKGLNFEEGEARIHVPIFTNAGVEFYLADEKMKLQEGECWYMNFSLKHRIANNSNEDRVHLVIDCKVNGWMAQLFDNCSTKCIQEKEEQFSSNEKLAIIENLKAMGTPESLRIAEEFFKSLA